MATNYPWFSEEACKKSCEKFVGAHPQKDMDLLRDIAKQSTIDEFHELCNCLYIHQYTPKEFYNLSYDESRELRDLCNHRVHMMLGGHGRLYQAFFKIWKSERWNGDETWRLFCDAYKPYDEAKAILTVVDISRYLGQTLTEDQLPRIHELYAHGRYWDLYVEDSYSFDIDVPSDFKKANRRRKEHTLRWRKFMNFVWEGDFASGRQMIDQYDREHDEWLKQKRKANNVE